MTTAVALEDLIAQAIQIEKRKGISTVEAVNEVYDGAEFAQDELRQLARIGFLRLVHEAKTTERNRQFRGPGQSPLTARYDVTQNGGTAQVELGQMTVSQLRSVAMAFRIRAGVIGSLADAIDALANFLVRRKASKIADLTEGQRDDAAGLISEAQAALNA